MLPLSQRNTALACSPVDIRIRRSCGVCSNDAVSWSGGNLRRSWEYVHQYICGNHDQRRYRIYHGTGSDSRRSTSELRAPSSVCRSGDGSGYCVIFPHFAAVHIHVRRRSNQPFHRCVTRSCRRICARSVLQCGSHGHWRCACSERQRNVHLSTKRCAYVDGRCDCHIGRRMREQRFLGSDPGYDVCRQYNLHGNCHQ